MDKSEGVSPGSPGSFDQKWNEFLSKLNFDKSPTAFINPMITVTKSGKIRMNGLDANEYKGMLQGSNTCPVNWDNVCPFGCHE